MGDLRRIIKAQARFSKQNVKWNHDSPQLIHAKTAFNSAFDEIIAFIERLEDGKVEQEHIEHILKNYGQQD